MSHIGRFLATLAVLAAPAVCAAGGPQSSRSQYYANQVLRRPVVSPYVFLGPGNGRGWRGNWGFVYLTIVQPLLRDRAASVNNSIAIEQLQQQLDAQQNYAPPSANGRTGWFGRAATQSGYMNHSHYYGGSVR
jgi:hypothetical protein